MVRAQVFRPRASDAVRMRTADALSALRRHSFARFGLEVERLDFDQLLEVITGWYACQRFEDVDMGEGGDMLLLQWGTSRLSGAPTFEYDLVRQLILDDVPDDVVDDGFWQLHVTLRFAPTAANATLGSGHRWCGGLAELPAFRDFVEAAPATAYVRATPPVAVEAWFECAG
jgi:hypothetical protein